MIVIDYRCNRCGDEQTNHTMDSFICPCGGDMKRTHYFEKGKDFEPYHDRILGGMVVSYRDKEKKMKRVKNEAHPKGVVSVLDDKKFMREMAYIQKHREEYKAMTMPGYKPRTQKEIERYGERRYDPNRPDIDRYSRSR